MKARGRQIAALIILGVIAVPSMSGGDAAASMDAQNRWERLRATPTPRPSKLKSPALVELRRTQCFGSCPVYSLTLHASGKVEFVGQRFVCAVGAKTAMVDREAASKLISDLARAGYFDLHWKHGRMSTDSPNANTRLVIAARSRAIHHYYGDDGAPQVLSKMEAAIDDVAGVAQWLPRREERGLFCVEADGTKRAISPF